MAEATARSTPRLPAVYLPNGGGPWPFVEVGLGEKRELDALARYLGGLRQLAPDATAPAARKAHPREEHLLPLMVIAGAAGSDPGTVGYEGTLAGLRLSAHHLG